jgi:hypothetical protein
MILIDGEKVMLAAIGGLEVMAEGSVKTMLHRLVYRYGAMLLSIPEMSYLLSGFW